MPLLKKRANYMVLLAHATHDEAIALGKKYPDFNLVVCSDGAPSRPPGGRNRQGRHETDRGGGKGMYAVVIGLYDDRSSRCVTSG